MRLLHSLGRLRFAGVVFALLTLAVVGIVLVTAKSQATPNSEPSAPKIVAGETPVGQELADQLGLQLEPGFHGNCSYFAEVEESGAGYCIEGYSSDPADLVVLAEALRGTVLTSDQVAAVRETLETAAQNDSGASS